MFPLIWVSLKLQTAEEKAVQSRSSPLFIFTAPATGAIVSRNLDPVTIQMLSLVFKSKC